MGLLDSLAAPVTRLLGQFGQTVTYRTHTLGAYDPVTGTSTDTTRSVAVSAMVEDYPDFLARAATSQDADGVVRGDKRLTIAAGQLAAVGVSEPTITDEVQVGGHWYRIVNIDAQYGGDQVLYYALQARR